jgi:DNA-binding NtrC family response regulator
MRDETADGERPTAGAKQNVQPGLLVVSSAEASTCLALPLFATELILGRAPGTAGILLPDNRLSRNHAAIARTDAGWTIRDLGSRNGTFINGEAVSGLRTIAHGDLRVLRLADTLVLPVNDVSAVVSIDSRSRADGCVVGWRLHQALSDVAQAAATSQTLVIQGESGTGKELAARTFHEMGPHASGPLVAVNCAAIPEGLAERLLFGTKRGAYSGAAADAMGYLQAANGGVLFLDEVGDLGRHVQAKLLRALETREVVPLGASAGQQIDVRVCVATHRDLRSAVADGAFRADLYYRLAPPEVTLPPLRERLDEIPRHVRSEIASVSPSLAAHVLLLEACMLRAWPGNIRELRKEIRHAATRAMAAGSDRVRVEHLSATAGFAFTGSAPIAAGAIASVIGTGSASGNDKENESAQKRRYVKWSETLTRDQIASALTDAGENVASAARSLGMSRSQLYREMARWSLRPPTPSTRSPRSTT